MFSIFSNEIKTELEKFKKVYEVRLRCGLPIYVYTESGVFVNKKIKITSEVLGQIIYNACNKSIYGYDEYIKNGFITTKSGARIGIAGEITYDGSNIQTIKNFTSLCVRIPNDIVGFSNDFLNYYNGGSVLIVSKSGVGKTTFLRDLTRNISKSLRKNVVVIDERNEISAKNGNSSFYLGDTVDVVTFANKNYGFTHAIRTLNSDYVITDELITESDYLSVINAVNSGVNVVATIHGNEVDYNNKNINFFANKKAFNYYVLLQINNTKRVLSYYDINLNKLN